MRRRPTRALSLVTATAIATTSLTLVGWGSGQASTVREPEPAASTVAADGGSAFR